MRRFVVTSRARSRVPLCQPWRRTLNTMEAHVEKMETRAYHIPSISIFSRHPSLPLAPTVLTAATAALSPLSAPDIVERPRGANEHEPKLSNRSVVQRIPVYFNRTRADGQSLCVLQVRKTPTTFVYLTRGPRPVAGVALFDFLESTDTQTPTDNCVTRSILSVLLNVHMISKTSRRFATSPRATSSRWSFLWTTTSKTLMLNQLQTFALNGVS